MATWASTVIAARWDAVKAADFSRSTVRSTSWEPGCSAVRLPTESTVAPAAAAFAIASAEKRLTPVCAITTTASPFRSGAASG